MLTFTIETAQTFNRTIWTITRMITNLLYLGKWCFLLLIILVKWTPETSAKYPDFNGQWIGNALDSTYQLFLQIRSQSFLFQSFQLYFSMSARCKISNSWCTKFLFFMLYCCMSTHFSNRFIELCYLVLIKEEKSKIAHKAVYIFYIQSSRMILNMW